MLFIILHVILKVPLLDLSILWMGTRDCQQTSSKMLKAWEGENRNYNLILQCKTAQRKVWHSARCTLM